MVYFIYSDKYYLNWQGHIFPIEKFRLVYQKLIDEKIVTSENLLTPKPATEEDVLLVHTPEYLRRLKALSKDPWQGIMEFEVQVSDDVIKAFYHQTGGTILASRVALEKKTAVMNLGGGFHHAFSSHGEGFCLINDLSVAIRVMQKERQIKRAMVIDCDLHQGNGTAHIFQKDNDVFTFSIHQENNYPIKQKSDLDIGLADFTSDEEYLGQLIRHIPQIIEKHKPELILYQAGADPYEKDQLGLLKLTKEGLRKRDELVIGLSSDYHVPIAATLGGGYPANIQDVVEIHCQTAKSAIKMWSPISV
jgi:acetoin utilization deacetylase AcuC-like enzyme